MEPCELRRGIDAKLVGQDLPDALVGAEGLGLAPVSVQGKHELAPDALPERVLCDQELGFADDSGVLADRHQGFDALLLGDQPQLIQACRLGAQAAILGDVGERGAAPEPERLFQHGGGDARVEGSDLPGVVEELVEPRRVQLRGIEPQPVAGGLTLDAVGTELLP